MTLEKYSRSLYIIVLMYVAVFSALLIAQFRSFEIGGMDLTNYLQAIWKIANGHTPFVSAIQTHTLVDHFTLTWYLIALFYKVIPHPFGILILHTGSISAVSIVLFYLVKEITHETKIAFYLSLIFLFSQYTERVIFSPIHPESFGGLFISLALLFMIRKQWFPYFLFYLLAITSNEDVGLYFIPVGVYLFFGKKQKTLGILTAVLSFAYLILIFKLKPFIGLDTQNHLNRFAHLGNSITEILSNIIFKPGLFITSLLNIDKLGTLFQVFLQVGFLPLASWWGLFVLAVPLLFKSLTNHLGMYRLWDHYSMVVLPFLWMATALGIRNILQGRVLEGQIKKPEKFIGILVVVLLMMAVSIQAFLPYSPLSFRYDWKRTRMDENRMKAWKVIEKIPAGGSVLTQEHICPVLAARKEIYVIHYPGQVPNGVPIWLPEYIVFDRSRFKGNWLEKDLQAADNYFSKSKDYEMVDAEGQWVLYRKK